MCGLVAILQLDGARPDMRGVASAWPRRIRHRGPDDRGEFQDGSVAFAHQRLSIIDLATGHQPMTFDGITVVFNGEIYNYIELRDELKRAGHEFRTTSDTEVLLRMYLQYGTDAIARLNGMFAFVLYDSRQRQRGGGARPLRHQAAVRVPSAGPAASSPRRSRRCSPTSTCVRNSTRCRCTIT